MDNVSELREQLQFLSMIFNSGMQESYSQNQEKVADVAIKSNPPLTSEELPDHGISIMSRETGPESLIEVMHTKFDQSAQCPHLSSAPEVQWPQTPKKLQQKQELYHMKAHSEYVGSKTKSLPSENQRGQPHERKRNGELHPLMRPEQPQTPRGSWLERKLDVAATEDASLPAMHQKQQEKPENQRQWKSRKLDVIVVLGVLAASKYKPAQVMTESPLSKLNPDNEHHDELQCQKNSEDSKKRRGRPRKWNLDIEPMKNCSPQSNLSSHKCGGKRPLNFSLDNEHYDLQLSNLPEQPQKKRGMATNLKLDAITTGHVQLPANYQKLQEETENQRQRSIVLGLLAASESKQPQRQRGTPPKLNSDSENRNELHFSKHHVQPQKQRERPRKLNPDNKLEHNLSQKSNLSSHSKEEERPLKVN